MAEAPYLAPGVLVDFIIMTNCLTWSKIKYGLELAEATLTNTVDKITTCEGNSNHDEMSGLHVVDKPTNQVNNSVKPFHLANWLCSG